MPHHCVLLIVQRHNAVMRCTWSCCSSCSRQQHVCVICDGLVRHFWKGPLSEASLLVQLGVADIGRGNAWPSRHLCERCPALSVHICFPHMMLCDVACGNPCEFTMCLSPFSKDACVDLLYISNNRVQLTTQDDRD